MAAFGGDLLPMHALLHRAGLPVTDLRVRDLGDTVRVEAPAAMTQSVSGVPGLAATLAEAGFAAAAVEVSAFRSGRLNTD